MEERLRPIYREVQQFRQPLLWLVVLAVVGVSIYGAVQQLGMGQPFGTNPAPDAGMIGVVLIFGFGFPLLFYVANLTTEVRGDGLYFRFFPFHWSFHKIPFEELEAYEVRTYRPLRDYGGWGIRYGRMGKAYNVSGNQGVQFGLTNGDRLMIGSQRPHEFAEALDVAMRGAQKDAQ